MAPRKQAKQAAAENIIELAAADGNVTPPKKRKVAAKSTAPKQAKTTRQVKAQEAATVFSPKNLRSRQKAVAPKNVAGDKSNKQKEEKKTDDNTGEQVAKKTRGGGKSAVKKAGTKTATAKPKAKAPIEKNKDQKNSVENIGNGISDENPKRATRRGKATEENVAPAATKVRVRKPRKRKSAEAEAIADDEEPPAKNDAEIVDNKKSREKAKKTAKAAVKEKNSTKISRGKHIEEEIKKKEEGISMNVKKEEGISMNLALESVVENDTSVDKSNNVSYNDNNKAEITFEMKDVEEDINNPTAFERSATFLVL